MRVRPVPALASIGLLLALVSSHAQDAHYDFVVTGARIVDGTGAAWFAGDIGIVGDRIAAIGDLHEAVATKRIDATGLVASPGFIDTLGNSEFNLLVDNRAASKITQGVTTEITGEGTSDAPLNERVRGGARSASPGGPTFTSPWIGAPSTNTCAAWSAPGPPSTWACSWAPGACARMSLGMTTDPPRPQSSTRCVNWLPEPWRRAPLG